MPRKLYPDNIQIFAEISAETHKRLRMYAAEHGLSLYDAASRLVAQVLDEIPAPDPKSPAKWSVSDALTSTQTPVQE